jgi:class 3 adenylate cyclase/CHASE2 domain-containing sensor protein
MERRRRIRLLVVGALAALAVELLTQGKVLLGVDTAFVDLWHRLAGVRATPQHTLLVKIDDRTLSAHRDEPMVFWGPLFARAIRNLRAAGAKVIALDHLFTVSAESWLEAHGDPAGDPGRSYDAPLRAELNKGDVVVAAAIATIPDVAAQADGKVPVRVAKPVDALLYALPQRELDLGLVNLPDDPDGVVRHFRPARFDSTFPPPRLSFALVAALRWKGLPADAPHWELVPGRVTPNADADEPIGFVGPSETIPSITFEDALAGSPALARARDRVVIIAMAQPNEDVFATPYSRRFFGGAGQWMSGGEIHANIIETLLGVPAARQSASPLRWLLELAVAIAAVMLVSGVRLRRATAGALALAAVVVVMGALVFRAGVILPTASMLGTIAMAGVFALATRLTEEERLRRRLRQVFGQHVSNDVVEALLGQGELPSLGGEDRDITVLFTDIRNFTTHSELLAPQEVVEMLNEYFTRACKPIESEGGMINAFIGDAILAIFGAPVTHADHAQRALVAAERLARVAHEFSGWMEQRFAGRKLPPFAIGVGIHTGPVVVGNIGSPRRMAYTAIGDTVNMASRLQGLSKTIGSPIIISEETRVASGGRVVVEKSQRVRVKGREGEVLVHALVRVS